MPNLNIIQIQETNSRKLKRSFSKKMFSKHDWLCGFTIEACLSLNKSKIKTEIDILYRRTDLCSITGAINILQFIIYNDF